MNTGQITSPSLNIVPSEALYNYIANGINTTRDVPPGIACIRDAGIQNNKLSKAQVKKHSKYSSTAHKTNILTALPLTETISIDTNENLLSVQDLLWLFKYIQNKNKINESQNEFKVYLHELLQGSKILLPKNVEIPRNPRLEEMCQKLSARYENAEYNRMTKHANAEKKNEDSMAYQMKQINRQLVAVFQFVMSVMAGFAFGFIGVKLIIVEHLDVGFRLLLGIIFSLIIALAEIYFLAKRLN